MANPTELSTFNSQPFNGLIFNDPLVEPVPVPVPEEPRVTGGGEGAGALQRFLRRLVELEGLGLIHIIGTGELLVLRGEGMIAIRGVGALEADDERTAIMLLLGLPGI